MTSPTTSADWHDTVKAKRPEMEARALFLHPAQPASQQGEATGLERQHLCWQHRPGQRCPTPQSCSENGCSAVEREQLVPHPTGDKVWGLVEKWRLRAKEEATKAEEATTEYGAGLHESSAYELSGCADELAAALDQKSSETDSEKNDERGVC